MNTTLYYNGKIYTMERENECFDSMLVRDGRIAGLYVNKPKLNEKVMEVNLEGKAMIPTFSDAHMHFVFSSFLIGMGLSISDITKDGIVPNDLKGVRDKIGKYISETNTKDVLCFNYMVASIKEERLPTRFELEEWFPDTNISIISMDGHSSAHTKEILKYAGIYSEDNNGILSGEDHEFNTGSLFGYYQKKKLNLFSMIKALKKYTNTLLSYGVTDITCLESSDDQLDNLPFTMAKIARRISKVTIRVSPQLTDKKIVDKLVGKDENKKVGGCGTWELDGAIGSKTAAFEIPYLNDGNNCGKAYYDLEQVKRMIGTFTDDEYQVLIHAIGSNAIDIAINAYAEILGDKSENPNRCRIEHFEFPLDEHIKKAADMNLYVSVQPGYSWMDKTYQHSYENWIDERLFKRQIPLKKIYDMGIYMLGSSDSPVQLPNPFIQIQGMVNYPIEDQRLSVYEALRVYTYNNAMGNFAEDTKGSLKEGKDADFLILDRNPFEIDKEGLIDIKVMNTYVKGKKVY
jgi:predicted amidohydrolase YtcJ